jgi:putative FmdB family regulatory protein
MPTYEYACLSCGTHVEVFQRFSEESLTVCGVCGGPLRKVFHPAGILFKGSGFYATDSRTRVKGSAASGDGEKSETSPGEKSELRSGSGSKGKAGGSAGDGGPGSAGDRGSGSSGDAGSGTKADGSGEKGASSPLRRAKEKSA